MLCGIVKKRRSRHNATGTPSRFFQRQNAETNPEKKSALLWIPISQRQKGFSDSRKPTPPPVPLQNCRIACFSRGHVQNFTAVSAEPVVLCFSVATQECEYTGHSPKQARLPVFCMAVHADTKHAKKPSLLCISPYPLPEVIDDRNF